MTYKNFETKLENGLTVVTTEMPHLHSADLAMFIRVGSRYEELGENGISHFLEHMLFNGTANYPNPTLLNKKLLKLGNGEFNGSTSNENTMFYLTIHPSKLEEAMEVFSDIFLNPLFDETSLEEEKRVVIEEIKGEEESSWDKLDNAMNKLLWGNHALGQRVLGSVKNIKSFNRDQIISHYKRFYNPANMILSVAGPVTRDEVENLANKYFGQMTMNTSDFPLLQTPLTEGPKVIFQKEDVVSTHFQLAFVNENYPANRFVFWVFKELLAEEVFTGVRLQRGLAYDLYTKTSENMDIATLEIEGCVSPKNFITVIDCLVNIFDRVIKEGFTQEELEQIINSYYCSLDFSLDRPSSLAARFAQDRFYGGVATVDEEKAAISSVNLDDLRNLAKQLFTLPNRHLLVFSEKPFSRVRKQKIKDLIQQGF